MRMPHVLLILSVALAGCGGMMIGTDAMRGAVSDAVDEDQTHLASAGAALTIPAMLTEVDRHTSRMDAIMDDMRSHMGSMQHCSGIGSMMDLRDGMRVEVDAHAVTMHTMVDIATARAEVEHHVGTMGTMLGDMGTMLDGMHCSGW